MNSPIQEPDFDGFDFPEKNNKIDTTEENETGLPILEEQINIVKSLECVSEELPQCEVCSQQFLTKKELRSHITLHLGQPRVVLKRCSNLHLVKKKEKDKYSLTQEKKGSLKLTLKKQNHRDFAVISRDLDFDSDNSESGEVAGLQKTNKNEEKEEHEDTVDDNNGEQTDQPPHEFENVMVNEDDNYQDDNYDNNDEDNFLEDNEERPSVEINEGDSGVGSDMANTCEKDDQNVDDLHNVDNYQHEDDDRNTIEEPDDPEESDPIDATYRETIENLKKIGEQTSTIREEMSPRDGDDSPDESSSDAMTSRINDNDALKLLSNNSAIELYPAKKISSKPTKNNNDVPRINSSINWNQIENLSSRDRDNDSGDDHVNKDGDQASKDNADNSTEAGLLLQNLLTEHHHRKNSEERSSVSQNSSVETEYVSLEKLAETVNKCRVCNEKFNDITMLDDHRLKAGHYQCNVPDCSSLVFTTTAELSLHKLQSHEPHNNNHPLSPTISIIPSQVNHQLSPRITDSASSLGHNSPSMTNHRSPSTISPHTNSPHNVSPHPMSLDPLNPLQLNRSSPLASHQTHSPSYSSQQHHHLQQQQQQQHHSQQPEHHSLHHQQQMIPPINFDQLPPPVQQLAQQVQRMALPQSQMPPTLPPGANTMIPGPTYFVQPSGRPPMYHRMPSGHQPGPPHNMQYPPHLAHLYGPQYGGPYSQYPGPSQMHPQMQQQLQQQMQQPRGRYPPTMMPNARGPRPPMAPNQVPRQRLKRPLPPQPPASQGQPQQRAPEASTSKQRRMDLLIPDRNEDADCHVIAQQKRNDGVPIIQNVQGATGQTSSRSDSTIHLTDSITLSVRQPGSTPAQVQNPGTTPAKKTDAKAVANVLAARGITVTPTANKNKSGDQQKQQAPAQQQQQPQQPQRTAASTSPSVTALNLNSAISIIPASTQRKQQQQQASQQQQSQQQEQQFAVPQNKQSKQTTNQEIERPPRPPTIDLTQESGPLMAHTRRGRPTRAALTCQICDKSFQNQEILIQHMASHRTSNKLDYKCNLCTAAYPTSQGLVLHKQSYHKELDSAPTNGGTELAIPVVDLKSPQTLSRLTSLGIQSYIPLSQLSAQTGGYFALPIVTIDSPRNPNSCNLGALGATSILSLGPLKHLSNR